MALAAREVAVAPVVLGVPGVPAARAVAVAVVVAARLDFELRLRKCTSRQKIWRGRKKLVQTRTAQVVQVLV